MKTFRGLRVTGYQVSEIEFTTGEQDGHRAVIVELSGFVGKDVRQMKACFSPGRLRHFADHLARLCADYPIEVALEVLADE